MNENPIKKCRTCLKNSTKTFPLANHAVACNPKTTYSELLQEYAKLEYPADNEHLMPQNICALCCHELRNAYTFIRQAQYCNSKLINLIAKQLPSLQQNEQESNKYLDKNGDKTTDCSLRHTMKNKFRIVSTSALLKAVELDEPIENHGKSQCNVDGNIEKEINEHTPNESISLNNSNANVPNVIDNDVLSNHQSVTKCPICEKIINPHNNLITHMRIQHDIAIPTKYLRKQEQQVQINYKIGKHKIAKRKLNQKPKIKVIKCSSCNYTARTYSALNFHNRSMHGPNDDAFKCQFCPYTNLKKFILFMHVKNSHKKLIRTLRMDAENKLNQRETFFNDTASNFSDTSATKEISYFLDDNENTTSNCSTSFEQEVIKSPSKITSDGKNDDYKDELSDEMFLRNILNMDNGQSTQSLPRRCDVCGNIYKNLSSLKTHQKNVHMSEENYKICPECGKKFKSAANLRYHTNAAHSSQNSTEIVKKPSKKVNEKRFMCTQCSYVCATITTLNIHINRHHTGEKPYKCDICYKSFIVKYNLKIHRYLHTGERPYKCSVCSKCFRCSQRLKIHKRIHTKERPYKCKECSKTFTQGYHLSLHKRIHLKDKNLNCTICDKLFETQTLLNMHRINEGHHDEVD